MVRVAIFGWSLAAAALLAGQPITGVANLETSTATYSVWSTP